MTSITPGTPKTGEYLSEPSYPKTGDGTVDPGQDKGIGLVPPSVRIEDMNNLNDLISGTPTMVPPRVQDLPSILDLMNDFLGQPK